MEPNLKTALYERNHKLDSLFSVKTQVMSLKKDKVTKEERNVEKTGVCFLCLIVFYFSIAVALSTHLNGSLVSTLPHYTVVRVRTKDD